MTNLLWLFPLGAFMNWFVRGGGWKSAMYGNKPPFSIPGKFINAIVYGGCAWWLSGSMAVAVFASIAMYVGSAPGLGVYVSAMKGESPVYDWEWGLMMMTFRGSFWGSCLALNVLLLSEWSVIGDPVLFASAVILAGLGQGFIYFGFIRLFENIKYNSIINHWTCSEILHGGLIWSALAFIVQTMS